MMNTWWSDHVFKRISLFHKNIHYTTCVKNETQSVFFNKGIKVPFILIHYASVCCFQGIYCYFSVPPSVSTLVINTCSGSLLHIVIRRLKAQTDWQHFQEVLLLSLLSQRQWITFIRVATTTNAGHKACVYFIHLFIYLNIFFKFAYNGDMKQRGDWLYHQSALLFFPQI